MRRKVISFTPNEIVEIYLDKIKKDFRLSRPVDIMNKLIGEYFLMKYGQEERSKLRKIWIKRFFNEED